MKRLFTFSILLIGFLLNAAKPAIVFKENKGQWPDKVLFGAQFATTKFYANQTGFNYCIYNGEDLLKARGHTHQNINHSEKTSNEGYVRAHNYEVNFIGGNLNKVIKKGEQSDYYNYFLGKDRSKWAGMVKAYADLMFKNVYDGVDLNIYSEGKNLKYDLIIQPNADVTKVKLKYKYVDKIEIVNGEIIVKTSVGDIVEKPPVAFQNINGFKVNVRCLYKLINESTIGFMFPDGYNKDYSLTIDPTVVVCSYSGSEIHAGASGCSYDANGNIYNFGYAETGYDVTPGAFQVNFAGYWDAVLSVYNSNGSSKLFSTYIGGDSLELPLDLNIKNNEITLLIKTQSSNYPCSVSGYDTTYNGAYDLAITKLDMTGSTLIGSTYIGGSNSESVDNFSLGGVDYRCEAEMQNDNLGNVYVYTASSSANFPTTPGVISNVKKGFADAVFFKLSPNLSNLVWSTYLGGSSSESGKSVRFDGTGGFYLAGTTSSTDFPVTPGALQTTKAGLAVFSDFYITHVNSTANSIIASTYLGVQGHDILAFMDLDMNNDVYICGHTGTPSQFIPTAGTYSNANGFNTIHKINSSLSSLFFKTKFGYYVSTPFQTITPNLAYSAFKVDSCQNIYIAGSGPNSFPTTPNALQPAYGGSENDLYFAVFSPNCASLKFGSFFGGKNPGWFAIGQYGEHSDGGINHFDNRGVLYHAICNNGGIPTTTNAYSPVKSSDSTIWDDSFVKIDMGTFVNAGSSYGSTIMGCPPFTANFVSTTNTGTTYWDFGNGNTSTNTTETQTYTNLGNYNVLLVVSDTNTCNKHDSIKSLVSIINPTEFDLGDPLTKCINDKLLIQSNISAVTYSWSTGQTSPNILVTQPGTYVLTINNGGCNTSDDIEVKISEKKFSDRFPNVITPNSDGTNDCIHFINYRLEQVEFIVYDRWGKEKYKTDKINETWCPDNLNDGTYYYVVNYKSECTGETKSDKGFISVFK